MPLARIFTRNPERTAALFSELQQQGYKVEVAAPDQPNLAPADLEIEFEVCERADVLDRRSQSGQRTGRRGGSGPRGIASPGTAKNTNKYAADL